MSLTAAQHRAYLIPQVSGPAPAIAKRAYARPAPPPSAPSVLLVAAGSPRPVDAGAYVQTTTAVHAARVHRNRQLAAHSLAHIKQTIATLEADNASLKTKDAALDTLLQGLIGKAAAQRER